MGRVHDILRAALNWAERLDLIVRNPAAKVERPRGAKPDINPPAPADVVRMISEASKPLALFLRLGALSGTPAGASCAVCGPTSTLTRRRSAGPARSARSRAARSTRRPTPRPGGRSAPPVSALWLAGQCLSCVS